MNFTKELVDDLAGKLLIGLSDDENKMVLDEFERIDSDCDIINTIENLQDVEPMTHALDFFASSLREDIAEASPSVDDLLKNSSCRVVDQLEVPKVVE